MSMLAVLMAFRPEALMFGMVLSPILNSFDEGGTGLCVQIMLRDGFKPVLRDVDG